MPQSIHQFAEKVALITDVANPVGRAVALQLALQGSFVVAAHLNPDGSGAKSVDQIRELGTLAHAVFCDVSDEEGARRAVASVNEIFGRLDLLVNCLKPPSESSFTTPAWSESVDCVDLRAARNVTRAAVALMEARPKPKIVNIGWLADESQDIDRSGQGLHPMALITKENARSLPGKFRVNCVLMNAGSVDEPENQDHFLRPGSVVAPDDVARIVTFLLSSEAKALNGQVLQAT